MGGFRHKVLRVLGSAALPAASTDSTDSAAAPAAVRD